MFRSTNFAERVRVVVEDVLEAVDIVLSEPLEAGPVQSADERPGAGRQRRAASLAGDAPEPRAPALHHPHRRPARIARRRRPGSVKPPRASCLCPVRAAGPGRHGPLAGRS
jgi:hypothetical protein